MKDMKYHNYLGFSYSNTKSFNELSLMRLCVTSWEDNENNFDK